MKVLLDENIDVRFKKYFVGIHEVYTVRDMNWNGITNGALLTLLAENKFDCWIVVDKNIPYQQNVSKFPCLVIVLDVFRNTLTYLQPLVPQLLHILQQVTTKRVIVVKEEPD